jgi:DNA invertase Pin-like site-specific DNA recombinase
MDTTPAPCRFSCRFNYVVLPSDQHALRNNQYRKPPMLIEYARVSTPDQKLDLQLDALRQAGCERLFQDVMSSTRLDRPGLQEALSHLRTADTLVIWKLDRLGRSVKGLITLTETLKARGIAFVSLQDKIDTTTPLGEFFFHVVGAFAQLERSLIVERTQAGLAAARARGRLGGRPRKVTKAKLRIAMAAMTDSNSNASEVARLLGINRTVLYRYVNGDGSLKPLGQALLDGTAGRPEADLDEAAD